MKARWVVSVGVIVGTLSSAITVLLLKPDAISERLGFNTNVPPEARPVARPPAFAALAVIDESRGALSFEEQKALFAGLSDQLRDPTSAQLRLLRRSTTNNLGICGELNAKNGFGAYVGFVPFMGGIIGDKAVLVMLDREVVVSLPILAEAQLAKFGCSTASVSSTPSEYALQQTKRVKAPDERVPATDVPKNLQGTILQLTGSVTLSNFKKFESFVIDNRDNVVGLKLSFKRSGGDESRLLAYGDKKEFTTYVRENQTSEIRIPGSTFEGGIYHIDGFYLVKMEFFAQGVASYKLEPVDQSQLKSTKGVQSTLLSK
ncbi:hypothetical protein [Bradyrhizobium sp. RT10b]|uniref:hypothetical protein n=1 Tax=Bradyrhizobium sp. RT10b TaxID=3156331 RepID=UPI00339741DA